MTLKITDWESAARTELSLCANKHMELLHHMVEEALSSCQKDEDFLQLMQLFSKLAGGNVALADRAALNEERLGRIINGRTLPVQSLRIPMLQLCWAVVKNQAPLQPLLIYLGLEAKVTADEPAKAEGVIGPTEGYLAAPVASEPEVISDDSSAQSMFGFDPFERVEDLDFSVRIKNAFKHDGIIYLGDLMLKSEGVFIRTPNFGRKSINMIKEFLSGKGLRLGQFLPENSTNYLALEQLMQGSRPQS